MRKKALDGPRSYGDWLKALSWPLTALNAQYLRNGKLKEKELRTSLFNRISDYVVEEFNRSAAAVREAEPQELVFRLEALCTKLRLCLFFRQLDFLAAAHREALIASLSRATHALVAAEEEIQNADVSYALLELCQIIGVKS